MIVSAPRTELAQGETRESESLHDRAVGAYLGLAIGDALGATVEFLTPGEIRAQYGVHKRIIGGGWLRLKPGQVTDDTEMSLALGTAILTQGKVEARAAAQAFSDWMRRKPVDIGNTVRRGIVHFRYSGEPTMVESDHDAGNGACMRCLPVALATLGDEPGAVQTASCAQAHVTHNNRQSDAGTECVIAIVQGALSGQTQGELLAGPVQQLVAADAAFGFQGRRCENPSGYIVDTLRAVFQALADNGDFASCVGDVVNRGGDADTTGAIVGMIAGALYGQHAIPEHWRAALDLHVHAVCTQQALALLRLSPLAKQMLTGEEQA